MTIDDPATTIRVPTRGKNPDGFQLWVGPSEITGDRIGVVITHIRLPPQQRKIGNMAQAWILPYETQPIDAVRDGSDSAVCGTCRYRPSNDGGCYVPIAQTAQRVWWAWRRFGSYLPVDADDELEQLAHKPLRIGAWGDPAAVPVHVWDRVINVVPGLTGYTHRWRALDFDEWGWCMASCDTAEEVLDARAAGWRTFRARRADEPMLPGERVCPAADEAPTHGRKNAHCATCLLCDGVTDRVHRPDVSLIVHGQAHKRAAAWVGGAAKAIGQRVIRRVAGGGE